MANCSPAGGGGASGGGSSSGAADDVAPYGAISFGKEAREDYTNDLEDIGEESFDDYDAAVYSKFKMKLSGVNSGELTDLMMPSDCGRFEVPVLHLMVSSLWFLRKFAMEFILQETGNAWQASEIQWVVTVPAIWTEYVFVWEAEWISASAARRAIITPPHTHKAHHDRTSCMTATPPSLLQLWQAVHA